MSGTSPRHVVSQRLDIRNGETVPFRDGVNEIGGALR
jgi:hypothetical protein